MTEPPADWARCRPWIEAALEHCGGTHWIEDVEAQLLRDELYFIPGERSALVLEHVRFPRRSVLHIWLAGGEMAEIIGLVDGLVTEAARELGCDAISLDGRLGWKRVFASRGWSPAGITLGKRVTVDEHQQEQVEHQGLGDRQDGPARDGDHARQRGAGPGDRGQAL